MADRHCKDKRTPFLSTLPHYRTPLECACQLFCAAGMPSFAALDMEGVAQQLAGWKAQAETAAVVDSDKVKALMEELEAANMRAHAYEVKV